MVGVDFDNTKAWGTPNVPTEGFHDASLKVMKYGQSKAGNDMGTAYFVLDNGDFQGHEIREWFTMGLESQFGESKLMAFSLNARNTNFRTEEGFPPQLKPSWAEYFEQFNTTPALRVRLELKHEYDLELDNGTWKRRVPKEEFDAHTGKKFTKAKIADFAVVEAKARLNVTPDEEPKQQAAPTAGVGVTAATAAPIGGDGAASLEDGLPF